MEKAAAQAVEDREKALEEARRVSGRAALSARNNRSHTRLM